MNQREIKFRAWDKELKKMWDVVGISFMAYDKDCEGEPEWKHTNNILEIAVRNPYDGITFEKPSWLPAQRFILIQSTGLHDKNGKEIYEGDVMAENGWEVIGNIYEHPELLTNQ